MDNKIGLWKKVSQKGNEYFVGKANIDGVEYKISLFKNNYKSNEKQPDYKMTLEKKEETQKVSKSTDEKEYVDFGKTSYSIDDEDLAF